jgi:hypothetical protein
LPILQHGKRFSYRHGCYGGCGWKKGKKFLLFVAIFWLLKQGHPFIAFKAMKMFFQSLKVKNTPMKHWNNNAKGELQKFNAPLSSLQQKLWFKVKYIIISCDEVTMIDN